MLHKYLAEIESSRTGGPALSSPTTRSWSPGRLRHAILNSPGSEGEVSRG